MMAAQTGRLSVYQYRWASDQDRRAQVPAVACRLVARDLPSAEARALTARENAAFARRGLPVRDCLQVTGMSR